MSLPIDNNAARSLMREVAYAVQHRNIGQFLDKTPLKRNDSVTSNPSGQLSPEEIQRQGGLRV